jgi:hypothetical protein
VVVLRDAVERGDEVVLPALVPGLREVLVRPRGELVLRLARDAPGVRGEGLVVTHRQAGARLGVAGLVGREVGRTDLGQGGEPALGVLGVVGLDEDLAELVADGQRGVRRGVGAAGDAGLDLAELDLGRDLERGLQTGAAGLLDVLGGRLGRQRGAEHDLAGEVEVAAVLEDGAGDELADALALEAVAGDEAVERRGEHLLVGDVLVDGVRPGERDPVAADDDDLADALAGRGLGHCAARRGGGRRGRRLLGRGLLGGRLLRGGVLRHGAVLLALRGGRGGRVVPSHRGGCDDGVTRRGPRSPARPCAPRHPRWTLVSLQVTVWLRIQIPMVCER